MFQIKWQRIVEHYHSHQLQDLKTITLKDDQMKEGVSTCKIIVFFQKVCRVEIRVSDILWRFQTDKDQVVLEKGVCQQTYINCQIMNYRGWWSFVCDHSGMN